MPGPPGPAQGFSSFFLLILIVTDAKLLKQTNKKKTASNRRYSVTFISRGKRFNRKMWALVRHAAAHTSTSLGPLGKTHTAGVRRTGGLSLRAAHIYIQIEAGRARLMCSLWLLTSVLTLFCGCLTCLFSAVSFKVTKR